MKNRIIFVFVFFLCSLIFISCSRESEVVDQDPIEAAPDDGADLFVIIQPFPLVDLVIASYTTNVVPTTTGCGGVLPDVSCLGQRSFTATVTIVNNGPTALPAGNISVDWTDTTAAGSSTQRQTVAHGGIAVGGTLSISRPYWMGPCGCVPPFTYYSHTFFAVVDPANLIPETNNNNNTSATYAACDGC